VSGRPFVFDKGAWHLTTVKELELDRRQAWVHIGHVFAWLVRRSMVQQWLRDAEAQRFADFDAGHITGRQLLQAVGGALVDDMLTDEGLAFALHYLDPRFGTFIEDYRSYVVGERPSDYHVPDDEPSAARVAAILDAQLEAWRAALPGGAWRGSRPDPWAVPGVDTPPDLPDHLPASLPVLPVGAGAPLPGGAVSATVRTAGAVAAVRDALQGDLLLALLPDDAEDVGVVAWVEEASERGDGFLVGMRCLARCARDPTGGWRVHGDPAPSEDETRAIRAVRDGALALVRQRRERDEPLGLLALVPALDGGTLLDLVARALPLEPDEQLVALESFDLTLRADLLRAALDRVSAGSPP